MRSGFAETLCAVVVVTAVPTGCSSTNDGGSSTRTSVSGGSQPQGEGRDAATSTAGEPATGGTGDTDDLPQPSGGGSGPSDVPVLGEGGAPGVDAGDASSGDVNSGEMTQPDAAPQPRADSGSGSVGNDFGLPCDESCASGECYDPGTHENPICSKHCSSDADCGEEGVCQQSGNTGKWCFHLCASNADCQVINDDSSNPLFCAGQHDPDSDEGYGSLNGADQAFCIQSSEP